MARRVLTRSVLRMTRGWSRAIIFRPPGARRRPLLLSASFTSDNGTLLVATTSSSTTTASSSGEYLIRAHVQRSSSASRACDTAHAGSRAITRARGGRGRSSESMTGTRRSEVRALHGAVPDARPWTACAGKSHRAVCRRQRAIDGKPRGRKFRSFFPPSSQKGSESADLTAANLTDEDLTDASLTAASLTDAEIPQRT